MTNLIVVTGDFDGSTTRTQGFVDCGIIGREVIVMRSGIFDWFLGFFSKGGRHSGDGDQRGGSLFNKGGSYGSGLRLTLS